MSAGRIPTTANSPLTAKGDLFSFSTAPARLAVGSNGDTIVADSSTSTGLRYTENYAAGKNAIINGAFNNWQRGTSVALTNATRAYGPDRIAARSFFSAGTSTISQQTFTPGTAPVAGYEAQYFARISCGSTATAWQYDQRIEDVRVFAAQTVTFSFYIKASVANASTTIEIIQNFGSGGSTSVTTNATGPSVTTAWQRFSVSVAIPSVSGKTIGTSSFIEMGVFSNSGVTNSMTVDTWGWQVEDGSVATAFQTATGTIQGELAAAQRYYYRQTADATAIYAHLGQARGDGATSAVGQTVLPVTMRVTPTSVDYATVAVTDGAAVYGATAVALAGNQNDAKFAAYTMTFASGVTQFRSYYVVSNNSATGYLGFSAEL